MYSYVLNYFLKQRISKVKSHENKAFEDATFDTFFAYNKKDPVRYSSSIKRLEKQISLLKRKYNFEDKN